MANLLIKDSQRLTYELMATTDADLLWQLDQDSEVMRYINGGKKTSKSDIDDIMLPRMDKYRDAENGWGIWKVCRKSDRIFLGWVLVRPMHFFTEARTDDNLELGWRFHQKYWGNGYATESAKAVMQALRQQKGITNFAAIADKDNHASINIMKKIGMTFLKRDLFIDPLINEVVDYYSIQDYSG